MNKESFEEWVVVFTSGTDYEADIVRDRLDDSGIPAVVLTHRDHAFNLTVGDLSGAHVLVPPERLDDAIELLEAELPTDRELDAAAMSADPVAPPAHGAREEAMLDSGIEEINLTVPDEDDDEQP